MVRAMFEMSYDEIKCSCTKAWRPEKYKKLYIDRSEKKIDWMLYM